jgi:hypothetical protein
MRISGFAMVRNATKYYFPIKESISSILPIVDEFIVAMGESDPGDFTEREILSINSDKVKIIHRNWDEKMFHDGEIFRFETDIALSHCTGDWCFYLQADEVVHENDLPLIKSACEKYLDNKDIDGFLFHYKHFWGDYDHIVDSFHGWYNKEIRIIRNYAGISSFKDAQSFRKGTELKKLKVVEIPANIYHYGWVRPPVLMRSKKKEQDSAHWGKTAAEKEYQAIADEFNYGALRKIPLFTGSHPAVMSEWMQKFDWKNRLNYGTPVPVNRQLYKHEKSKYRFLTFIEQNILGGRSIFGYRNWKLGGKEKKPILLNFLS